MDKQIFVQNIKKYCGLRGVKPTVACRESGAGKDIINRIETGGSVPSVERVQMLAEYLGVTVSELLGEMTPGKSAPTSEEVSLLSSYRLLNDEGQEKLLDYADDLVSSGKYKKAGPAGLGKKA